MDVTFHIGPHKTGTTAVQTACTRYRARLARAGVLYPRTNWLHPAHHRLAFAMKGRHLNQTQDYPDFNAELAALTHALAAHQGDRALISSEEFFSAPKDSIARLAKALSGRNVRILCFLRQPDRFLLSAYAQKTRQPGNGFHAPLSRFVAEPRRIAPDIDYETCLTRWAEVFGWKSLDVEIYEDGPVLPRVLAHLGLSPQTLPDPPGVNRSAPAPVIEIMRLAKARGLPRKAQAALLKGITPLLRSKPPLTLTDAERAHILRVFAAGNTRVFKQLGRTNPFVPPAQTQTGDASAPR